MLIRVAIYEDNLALRDALEMLVGGMPGFHLTRSCPDAREIELQLAAKDVDVYLMDIDLPGRSGIEATKLVKQLSPHSEVLMLTVFDEDDKVFQALCAGASGYLLKKTPPGKIMEAIREVFDGGVPMTPSIARKVLKVFPRQASEPTEMDKLSPREQAVLQSLAKGNSYKMVASELEISNETVRTHVKRIYEKLQVHSLVEAINKTRLNK